MDWSNETISRTISNIRLINQNKFQGKIFLIESFDWTSQYNPTQYLLVYSRRAELDSVIVDVGPREFAAGLVYVALSRVRRMQNLYFDPFRKRPRFLSIGKTKVFAQRVKQDEREKISDARYALLAREKMEQKKQ